MPEMKVLKYPDSTLRRKADKVNSIDEIDKKILSNMADTMYLNQGVGLAALQVGIDKQIAVIDTGSGLIKMINPVIVKKEGSESQEEGCLSVPNVTVKVKRAKKVTVNFLNERGEAVQLKADGLLARAIQHEIDHLVGVLIIDHLTPIKKILMKKRLRKLDKSAKL